MAVLDTATEYDYSQYGLRRVPRSPDSVAKRNKMAINCGSVLVVDGDPASRDSVVEALEQAGYACRGVDSGDEALRLAREEEPAMVLMADVLPGIASYELCRALRDEFGEILPIFFLSRLRKEPLDCVAGLLLGADDYIVEPYAYEELVARVRRAVTRASAFRSLNDLPTHTLTLREVEVLNGLANGLSQREIAQELIISPKTVGTHIQRILGKLDVHSRAEAVAAAYQRGIVGPPSSPNGADSVASQ
jgi:DNA-binding NarL/FixJ family response regulator